MSDDFISSFLNAKSRATKDDGDFRGLFRKYHETPLDELRKITIEQMAKDAAKATLLSFLKNSPIASFYALRVQTDTGDFKEPDVKKTRADYLILMGDVLDEVRKTIMEAGNE
jgi:hypothetical protein